MHVTLEGDVINAVQLLSLGKGRKGGYGHYLSLTPGEYAAAVYAGQYAHLAPDGAYLVLCASVGADLAVDYLIPYDFLSKVVEYHVYIACGIGILLCEVLDDLLLYLLAALLAYLALKGVKLPLHLVSCVLAYQLSEGFVGMIYVDFHLGLAALRRYALDKGHYLLYFLVSRQYGVKHFLLGKLICAGLHHHDSVLGTCNCKVQLALMPLLQGGIDDIPAVYHADRHSAGRACKGGFTHGQSRGRAYHAQYLGLDVGIH